MSSTVKRAAIGYCVAFGNMFFAHGLFFVLAYLFNDGSSLLFYVLQLVLNIVLHFTVLKKQFQPVKESKPLYYFLLTVTAVAVWTGAYFIFYALLEYDIIDNQLFWNSYPEAMLGFLPLLLIFTIVFSVIYYTLFRKRVGELFYFYTLGIMLAGTVPMSFILLLYPFD